MMSARPCDGKGRRETPDKQLFAAALALAGLGWHVLPLHHITDGRRV